MTGHRTVSDTIPTAKGLLYIFILAGFISGCDIFSGTQPQEHVQKAGQFINSGDLNSGVIELKNALQKDPNFAEARQLLGETYLKMGNGQAAWKELTTAKSLGRDTDEVNNGLLQALLLQGKFKEVVDETGNLETSGGTNAEALTLRASALLGTGEEDKAKSTLEKVLTLDGKSVNARIGLARIALRHRDFDQTGKVLNEAKDLAPDEPRIWYWLGQMEFARENYSEAEKDFDKAVSLASYYVDAQLALARIQLMQDRNDQAKKSIKVVEERDPNNPTAKYFRAYIAYKNGDYEKTKDILRKVLKNFPDHPHSLLLISDVFYKEGQIEQTISYLVRFLAIVPDYLPALRILASLYVKEKQPEKVISLLQPDVDRQEDPQLYELLGTAYLESGNFDKGSEYLQKSIELKPDSSSARMRLALGMLATGETDDAIAELQSVTADNPEYLQGDIILFMSYLKLKDFDKAISSAAAMIKKFPDNPLPYNLSGTAYLGKKDLKTARTRFENALKIDPGFKPALSNLARLDIHEKDYDAAEQRYQKILKTDNKDINAMVNLARLAAQKGNEGQVLEYLQKARITDMNALLPKLILARYYYRKHDSKKMLEVVNEAYKLNPEDPNVLILLGQAQRLNGMNDQAVATLKSIVEKYPSADTALLELGISQISTGDTTSAKRSLDKVLTKSPENYRALLASISVAINEKDSLTARRYLQQLKKSYPDSRDVFTLEGDILSAENHLTDAIHSYERAYEINPDQNNTIKLGMAYLKNKNGKGWDIFNAWLKQNPEDITVKLAMASVYQAENQNQEAIKLYDAIIKAAPDNVLALNNIAWLYHDAGDPRALDYAERAYKLAAGRSEVADTYGWILLQNGKAEQGYEYIKQAFEKMPGAPDVIYHNAAALVALGEKESAKKQLLSLLKEHDSFSSRPDAEKLLKTLR